MPESSESVRSSASETNEAVAGVTSTNLPSGSNEPGKPFHDLAQWATKAPEGETLISTAYGDKVTEDLKFVENTPGVHKPDPILVANNVTRKFGGMTAVDVKHFEIERHGITALIGPNGAGKTTFFNLMTGFDTPNTGEWQFDGRDMAHVQPEKVARMGMVRTFQLTKVMSRLTVLDNMLLGAPCSPAKACSARWRPACGKSRRRRTARRPRPCSNDSCLSRRRTISPAPCPVASASCSKWRVR